MKNTKAFTETKTEIQSDINFILNSTFKTYDNLLSYVDTRYNYYKGAIFTLYVYKLINKNEFKKLSDFLFKIFNNFEKFHKVEIEVQK